MEGIIPARAGFTPRCYRRHSSPTDHPRTRGVYGPVISPDAACIGSSPHARGLPSNLRKIAGEKRIIPARAGFTPAEDCGRFQIMDHPRTRGVYVARSLASSASVGSSPHARGLRSICRRNLRTIGSSPHARGLPTTAAATGRHGRIIPARAGFTNHRRRHGTPREDHPRTRGVYLTVISHNGGYWGSSPHARGLRTFVATIHRTLRIIPARAGFTTIIRESILMRSDHPRTRGVYGMCLNATIVQVGSSPHARGLLTHIVVIDNACRIIPARAGFTN